MDNLPNLEEAVAELFPDEYHPDRWLELLPQFITRHCALYDEQVKRYEQELEDWQQSAQLTPRPTYPVFPVVFALACEARAQYQGLSYRAVAVCLYTAQDRASFYEKKSDQLAALCHEYDEASMTLSQHYLQLRRATVDKWPN